MALRTSSAATIMSLSKSKISTSSGIALAGGGAQLVDAGDALQRLLDAVDDLALHRLRATHRDRAMETTSTGCSMSGIWLTRSLDSASRPRAIRPMMTTIIATGRLTLKSDRSMVRDLSASCGRSRGGCGRRPDTGAADLAGQLEPSGRRPACLPGLRRITVARGQADTHGELAAARIALADLAPAPCVSPVPACTRQTCA
jgi:hypothetical protein